MSDLNPNEKSLVVELLKAITAKIEGPESVSSAGGRFDDIGPTRPAVDLAEPQFSDADVAAKVAKLDELTQKREAAGDALEIGTSVMRFALGLAKIFLVP